MKRISKVKLNKIFSFIEEFGITLFIGITIVLLILNHLLLEFSSKYGLINVDFYFTTTFVNTLSKKDSTLITIAAVFIGIYFTVFTLLSSIKVDSTFSILTKKNFEKLLKYIRNAFIGSFIYLIFSLFTDLTSIRWFTSIIALIFLLYMLLSALRFGVIIYLIFNRDVRQYYETIEQEKLKNKHNKELYIRLDDFLKHEEQKREEDYHKKFAETFDDDK